MSDEDSFEEVTGLEAELHTFHSFLLMLSEEPDQSPQVFTIRNFRGHRHHRGSTAR